MRLGASAGLFIRLVPLLVATGCDSVDLPEIWYVDSLRVLGVKAEPPTLSPGASTNLSILCVDGSESSDQEPACNAEVAWFAQCNNPDQNDPEQCFGRYAAWRDRLPSTLADAAGAESIPGFGFGSTFNFAAPSDIAQQRLVLDDTAFSYGVSYVHFVVCAGQLVADWEVERQLPVSCRDPLTGETLDQRRFVSGVTTLYSYDRLTTVNPTLKRPHFDGQAVGSPCKTDDDCPGAGTCTDELECVPVVSACSNAEREECRAHCLSLAVTADSFNLALADGTVLKSKKSLWLEAFTNAGELLDDSELQGIDPEPGVDLQRTDCVRWTAPAAATEQARLWVVVRDDRGGQAWWEQRVIVR